MPELWPTLCATVWPRAARADISSTLDRKRSGFEAKTLHVALKGVESLLLEVELITRLPLSRGSHYYVPCTSNCDGDQEF